MCSLGWQILRTYWAGHIFRRLYDTFWHLQVFRSSLEVREENSPNAFGPRKAVYNIVIARSP